MDEFTVVIDWEKKNAYKSLLPVPVEMNSHLQSSHFLKFDYSDALLHGALKISHKKSLGVIFNSQGGL